jgi:hypothetical protein
MEIMLHYLSGYKVDYPFDPQWFEFADEPPNMKRMTFSFLDQVFQYIFHSCLIATDKHQAPLYQGYGTGRKGQEEAGKVGGQIKRVPVYGLGELLCSVGDCFCPHCQGRIGDC